jgi:hypothetical protein
MKEPLLKSDSLLEIGKPFINLATPYEKHAVSGE